MIRKLIGLISGTALSLSIVLLVNTAVQSQTKGTPTIVVSPTRVILDGKRRSASISVANNGTAEGTYMIKFTNKKMLDNGAIVDVEDGEEGPYADKFVRTSPRRVTLAPGAYQNVRVLARKPKGLEDGEYRSHLRFSLVPIEDEQSITEEALEEGTVSVAIKANFGVSIPVIVRHGKLDAKINIVEPNLQKVEDGHQLSFKMERDGSQSVYGDVSVVYTNSSGKEYVVKNMGGIAVYTPNTTRKFDMLLDVPNGVSLNSGKLAIVYAEKEKDGGELIAKNEIVLQ